MGIKMLGIASDPKYVLISAGFTIESIINFGWTEIGSTLGIVLYVAKIFFNTTKNLLIKILFYHKIIIYNNCPIMMSPIA
jgi:hypothetical protein